MDSTGSRSAARTLAGTVLLASLLILGTFLPLPASAITVGPGVSFAPTGSWASLSFGTTQTFSSVRVDVTGVTFDSVRFGMVKSPASLPRMTLLVNTWSPLQTVANATVVDFTGDASTASSLWLALSGEIPAHEYVLQVDGAEVVRRLSNQTGFVWFAWSGSGSHVFNILLGWRTGLPPPVGPLAADFTYAPSSPGVGQTISFTSVNAGGFPPYVDSWDFGDGARATGANVTHAFAAGGNYTAVLTATDVSGATSSASHRVAVQGTPPPPGLQVRIVYAPTGPVAGELVNFSTAISGGALPFTYLWNFGDGASASNASPAHAYATVGSYLVDLTLTDSASQTASDSATVNVTAAPPPVAGTVTAAFDYAVDGATVSFSDRSNSSGGLPIVRWVWFLGDGTSSTERDPVHAYALPGFSASYTVWLTAYDTAGHVGATARVVTLVNWFLVILLLVVVLASVLLVVVLLVRRRRRRKASARSSKSSRPPPSG